LSSKPTGGEKSTGLGLAIVKKLVNLHGGQVGVKSNKKNGCTFFFDLYPYDPGLSVQPTEKVQRVDPLRPEFKKTHSQKNKTSL
jgi:Histidine kinase-, DNA gyrase B-, and HSP90-like ATPase